MINAAIVGLGWWGKELVNSVQGKSSAIRFVAAHNLSQEKSRTYCAEKGLEWRPSVDALLADPQIDALVFAAKHGDRPDQVVATARAGKHVFVEKPFALNLADADRALAAVTAAQVVFGVGYQRRQLPPVAELRARFRDGRLGKVGQCVGEATAPGALTLPDGSWRLDADEAPAGGMTALGVHLLDTMIDLFGHIETVYCVNRKHAATRIEDVTTVVAQFASGTVGTIICSMASTPTYRLAAFGTNGLAEASLDTFRFLPTPKPGVVAAPEVIASPAFDPLRAELEAFAQSITTRTPFPITPDQLRHGVAAFEAIVRSGASGRPERVAP